MFRKSQVQKLHDARSKFRDANDAPEMTNQDRRRASAALAAVTRNSSKEEVKEANKRALND